MENKVNKNIVIILLSCLLSYCSNGGNNEKNTEKKIISSINGEKIFLKEFEDEVLSLTKNFNTTEPLNKSDIDDLKKNILGKLIEKKLLFQEAKRLNLTATEEEIEKKIQDITGDYPPLRLKEVLERKGITFQKWKSKIKENIIIEKLIEQEINNKIFINEEELKKEYEMFPDEFLQPLSVHARQIVVETESEARAIRKEILKGADFVEMAKTKSLSPDGQKGGDLGFFSKGQMPKEFDDAVFNLKTGKVSDVIQTPYGYHLFVVLDKKNAKKMDFQEVKDKIKRRLIQQKQKEMFLSWIKQLKDSADIVISEAK